MTLRGAFIAALILAESGAAGADAPVAPPVLPEHAPQAQPPPPEPPPPQPPPQAQPPPPDTEPPSGPPVPWPDRVIPEYVLPCGAALPPKGKHPAYADWTGSPLWATPVELREIGVSPRSDSAEGCLTFAGACAGATVLGIGGLFLGACLGGFSSGLASIIGAACGLGGLAGGVFIGAELARQAAPALLGTSPSSYGREAFHQIRRRRLRAMQRLPLAVHPAVGWRIDADERRQHGLFPDEPAFVAASFFYDDRPLLFLQTAPSARPDEAVPPPQTPETRVFAAPFTCLEEAFDSIDRLAAPMPAPEQPPVLKPPPPRRERPP